MVHRLQMTTCTVLCLAAMVAASARAQTVAHWDFGQASSTTVPDINGGLYNGDIVGTPTPVPGPGCGSAALLFDGTGNQYVTTNLVPYYGIADSFTWEVTAWFENAPSNRRRMIGIESTNNAEIGIGVHIDTYHEGYGHATTRPDAYASNGGDYWLRSAPVLAGTGWHHYALVRDVANGVFLYYVDRQLQYIEIDHSTNVFNGPGINQPVGLACQSHNAGWDQFFEGALAEARISDGALTPDQFLAPPFPVEAHWPFDDMSGSTLTDISGHARAGAISGATWATGLNQGALDFDGIANRVTTSYGPTYLNTDSFTLEVIANAVSGGLDPKQVLIGFEHTNDGQVTIRPRNPSNADYAMAQYRTDNYGSPGGQTTELTSSFGVTDTDWHHYALVRDALDNKVRFYIDHVLQEEVDDTSTQTINTAGEFFGLGCESHSGSWDMHFKGQIDEARIVSRALLPGQFLSLVNSGEVSSYGLGCPGTAGITPRISVMGTARANSMATLVIDRGLAAAPVWAAFGFTPAAIPVRGCTLLVGAPIFLPIPALSSSGAFALNITLPPGVSQQRLFMQAMVPDASAPHGYAFSNGEEVIFE
ncbi:MAG: LamG-like jellyroll fold domain-containing protein [Planctomycetota bacterium]